MFPMKYFKMLIETRFVKWIRWKLFGYQALGEPSKNLHEKAEDKVRRKWSQIETRSDRCEVDARPTESCSMPIDIRKMLDSFEFSDLIQVEDKTIDLSPDQITVAKLMKTHPVALKLIECDAERCNKEMRIAWELRDCHFFLSHLFNLRCANVFIIVMEHYTETLHSISEFGYREFADWAPHADADSMMDTREVLHQLCEAIDFMHDRRIAHRYLNMKNVAVKYDGQRFRYKITNFSFSVENASNKNFKDDIEALGEILKKVFKANRKFAELKSKSIHDELLCVHLIELMTKPNHYQRPSVKTVKSHPFLWSPRETLHFVVQMAKNLESDDRRMFTGLLFKISPVVFDDDWRADVDINLLNELKAINYNNLPCPDIRGLVKTIRNLHVHHLTRKLQSFVGPTEDSLLNYWTEHFPQLIPQLYSASKMYNNRRTT